MAHHKAEDVCARFPVANATTLRIQVHRDLVRAVPEEQLVFMMLQQERLRSAVTLRLIVCVTSYSMHINAEKHLRAAQLKTTTTALC